MSNFTYLKPYRYFDEVMRVCEELVENKFLDSDGTGRGTYYFLPGCHPVSGDSLSPEEGEPSEISTGNKLSDKPSELSHKDGELSHKLSHKDGELSHKLSDHEDLKQIAELVSSSERSSREEVKRVIVCLCGKGELSVQEISELLKRKEQTVRKYIDDLCQEGHLVPKFPVKTHPKQRYHSMQRGGV